MSQITDTFEGKTWASKFTWIPAPEFKIETAEYPMTQSYGVCFTDDGKIVIINGDSVEVEWKIPGGTIEPGEHPDETLSREFMEEVTIEIEEPVLLGAQLCEDIKKDSPNFGKKIYQLRYACKAKVVHELQMDPATGNFYNRQFVPADKVTEYVRWGNVGDEIFRLAIEVAKNRWRFDL